jgi:AGZA family xanthine/uracil permease-like MFS transporter
VIVLLAVTGFRTAVFSAVPPELKVAIAVGIGLFIAFIGLVDAGFVRRIADAAGTTVPVGLGIGGSIASWPTAVFVVGLLITSLLVARGVRAGILLGVAITTVIAVVVEAVVRVGPSMGTNPRGWRCRCPRCPTACSACPTSRSSARCRSARSPGSTR